MFKGMDPSLKYTFYGIFTIFLGLFIATYHTLTIAFTNNEGVMNKNYYEIGLKYEHVIEEQKKLKEEGYHFESSLLSTSPTLKTGINEIEIKFLKGNENLPESSVEVKIEKRATEKFTHSSSLLKSESGQFLGKLNIETEGKWFLTITGTDHGKVLKKYFPIDVVN